MLVKMLRLIPAVASRLRAIHTPEPSSPNEYRGRGRKARAASAASPSPLCVVFAPLLNRLKTFHGSRHNPDMVLSGITEESHHATRQRANQNDYI